MRRVILALLVTFGFAILGSALMKPVYAHKDLVGPDGQVVRNATGQPVIVRDHMKEFRINWPGWFCFACAAVSLLWTLFMAVLRIAAYFWGRAGVAEPLQGAELKNYILWRRKNRETQRPNK